MSEKPFVVPEVMMRAVNKAVSEAVASGHPSNKPWEFVVGIALRWLSEHPLVPTKEQALALRDLAITVSQQYNQVQPTAASETAVAVEWQRIMFLASKPEVPGPSRICWRG